MDAPSLECVYGDIGNMRESCGDCEFANWTVFDVVAHAGSIGCGLLGAFIDDDANSSSDGTHLRLKLLRVAAATSRLLML